MKLKLDMTDISITVKLHLLVVFKNSFNTLVLFLASILPDFVFIRNSSFSNLLKK